MKAAGFIALIALVLVACGPTSTRPGTAASAPADRTPVGHIQRVFTAGWKTSCSTSAGCEIVPIGSFTFSTPPGLAFVDVQVTATLNYKISKRDRADVTLTYTQSPAPGPLQTMPPGTFRLASSGDDQTSSTTVTWAKGDLEANGQAYYFQVGASAHDLDSDQSATVSGSKVVLVVDMWTP